jgi:hypothetical protein
MLPEPLTEPTIDATWLLASVLHLPLTPACDLLHAWAEAFDRPIDEFATEVATRLRSFEDRSRSGTTQSSTRAQPRGWPCTSVSEPSY